jgi:D-alanine-D-alanine ligase
MTMANPNKPDKPPRRSNTNGGQNIRRALGPVNDLESHVPTDWWRRIFTSLYIKTDADVIADTSITANEVDTLLEILQPAPDTTILDLCCGQGRHTLELHRRGYTQIEGLDRSRYLIQKAKKQARSESLSARFREGDARKTPYKDDSFDVVMILGNSFGYFESVQDDLLVLQDVFRILKPQGTLLLDLADGEYLKNHYEPRSWEWADKKLFVCRERELSSDGQRLITREIINHTDKGVVADQFYAERLYTRDSITRLLQDAGFSRIEHLEGFTPASTRNQDLGMMAQRILLTCTAPLKQPFLTTGVPSELREVVVILGDPYKTDAVKPDLVFDDDDFHTINELKVALENGNQRHYTYLDNHDTLIDDLRDLRNRTDLVLNLCDEGFENDPHKELHVPSLLELLHIPYTGGGPQCLAFCYDKSLVRGIAKEMNIPVPEGLLIKADDSIFDLPMQFPIIVKPNFGDSSFGIIQDSVVQTPEELIDAVAQIRRRFGYQQPVLAEEFLLGKDLSVGIIGNPPHEYMVLPIIEEDYSSLPPGLPHLCGYEAKWLPDSPYWNLSSIPAVLTESTHNFLEDASIKLFVRLECRDYARFDWRLDSEGNPKLLEVNPNPGWCWDGHLAKMSQIAGLSYSEMLEAIISAAAMRLATITTCPVPQM